MASADPARRLRPDAPALPAIGLRERKKQKTREAIQRAALRLFTKRGYDETTIEEIAAAVEISPSTFFNYFPTKEDVVLYDMYDRVAIEMFVNQPKNDALDVVARRVLESLADAFEKDKEMMFARGKLILEIPELRARMWDELERTHALFTRLLVERGGRRGSDFELRVTARLLVSALYEAAMEWMRTGGRDDLVTLAERALDVLESGADLASGSAATAQHRRTRSRTGARGKRPA
jgi:AcrR family transcriptional regulator